jgi:hypothetical protein
MNNHSNYYIEGTDHLIDPIIDSFCRCGYVATLDSLVKCKLKIISILFYVQARSKDPEIKK